jgi:endoglucanase
MFLQILKNKISLILYITTTILFISSSQFAHAKTQFNGVNLAGADFGTGNLPGTFNTDYTYPTHQEVDYFISKGMNVFRLPFMWERIQNDQNGPLNQEELARKKDIVAYAT